MTTPVVLTPAYNSADSGNTAPAAEMRLVDLVCGATARDIHSALDLGVRLGAARIFVGGGRTAELWQALATVASIDVAAARAIEPHLDALGIIEQVDGREANIVSTIPGASSTAQDVGKEHEESVGAQFGATTTWGVFAAEGGPDPLRARPTEGGWQLNGTKLWCSLADRLTAALVIAERHDGRRQLFAVLLDQPGVHVVPGAWHARGLAEVPSGPVEFSGVPAIPVGEPGWYLARTGFRLGGIGVAACWFGGAVAVARALQTAAHTAVGPDPAALPRHSDLMLAELGAVDIALEQARRALWEAAIAIDGQTLTDLDATLLAARVRATVARATEEVITRVGHALGPAPLALDADHAKRVADLSLYVAQHHAGRDDASLGAKVAALDAPW